MVSGELKGISVDILIAASLKVKCPIRRTDIRVLPWARAYKMALNKENIALFGMSRSKERDTLFQWAGPYATTKNALITRKSTKISIDNIEDLRMYTVGAIRDDISQKLALDLGVNKDNLRFANHPENLAKMLAIGRVDIWAYNDVTARWILRKLGYETDKYEIAKILSKNDAYFAFSKNTDKAAVALLQKGIDLLSETPGKYGESLIEDIVSNYL